MESLRGLSIPTLFVLETWRASGPFCTPLGLAEGSVSEPWDWPRVPKAAGKPLGLGLISLPPSGRKVRYRELLGTQVRSGALGGSGKRRS